MPDEEPQLYALGTNYVVNGGFETGNFNNWQVLKSDSHIYVSVTSQWAAEGRYSAYFDFYYDFPSKVTSTLLQTVDIHTLSSGKLTASLKYAEYADNGRIIIRIDFYNSSGTYLGGAYSYVDNPIENRWWPLTVEKDIPTNAYTVQVKAIAESTYGEINIDDIRLEYTPPPPVVSANIAYLDVHRV
jgi:hypothetical protein